MIRLVICTLVTMIGFKCLANSHRSTLGTENYFIEDINEYYPEPKNCDEFHSNEYPCDGYTLLNLPMGEGSPNLTEEIETNTEPDPYFIGLQRLGSFDKKKPSVIFIHGWNVDAPDHVFGLPDQWVQQWRLAGYNVFHFHWAELSYDSGYGCLGLGSIGMANGPCRAAQNLLKKGGASDLFLEAYRNVFTKNTQPVRLVAQSLGANLAIYSLYRMHIQKKFRNIKKPNRIDLIDPFIMPGFGPRRNSPFDGQMPPHETLPDDIKGNLIRKFIPGSACHTNIFFGNYLSQYCQAEGMLYKLVKDFNVGILTFASIVARITASDFSKIGAFQASSSRAYGTAIITKHTAPNASYMYSISPGEPKNGYDASTSDEKILEASKRQIAGENMRRIQTSGFNTITFQDDRFKAY